MSALPKEQFASDFIRTTPGNQRMGFLPRHFGPLMLRFEANLYNNAERTITGIAGKEGRYQELGTGYWEYATTHNGKPFAYLKVEDTNNEVSMTTMHGYGEAHLSTELAGIVVSAVTIVQLVQAIADSPRFQDMAESLIDTYHDLLRDGREIARATGYSDAFFSLTD